MRRLRFAAGRLFTQLSNSGSPFAEGVPFRLLRLFFWSGRVGLSVRVIMVQHKVSVFVTAFQPFTAIFSPSLKNGHFLGQLRPP
jgi:hypothetical protein